ncbi:MAG: membrane protein insertion efficiency factor YidD [Acetobacter sp.]|nr:membrane protein insertion efficiency factor YidD [Acetobacter sp.]
MKKAYKYFTDFLCRLIIFIIKFYKKIISPLLPCACRYTPTCSEYMIQAISFYGIWKGTYLGIRRILRCHPWGECGEDPVPLPKHKDTD